MKKIILFKEVKLMAFSLIMTTLFLTISCDNDGEGWNDLRYSENYELTWDNPNPKTGAAYTEEELSFLKYDPSKEERFKGEQAVVLNLLASKDISEVKISDALNGSVLLTVTQAQPKGDKFSIGMNTSLTELNIEEGSSKVLKFDIIYKDKSIGSTQFRIASVVALPAAATILKGQWKFDNAANLTAATIGNDLVLGGGMVHAATNGVSGSDGAVLIDKNSHYIVNHGLPASGGDMVNNYTFVFDLNVPTGSYDTYVPLVQTSTDNSRDAASYIAWGGFWINGIGSGAWYSALEETWHRVVITVGDGDLRVYVDGEKVYSGAPNADGVQGLDLSKFLLFADNNGEDAPIRISEVMLFDITFANEWITEDVPGVGIPIP